MFVNFQARVEQWMLKCFTPEISKDMTERCDRFIEEALELCQSLGYTRDRAHALVDYVFGRPVGEPTQETGGVMVTLCALANTANIVVTWCAEIELDRINDPEVIEKIRAKQAAKPTGSALPIWVADPILPGYAFCAQQRDGNGYKVTYGFNTMEQGHAFTDAVNKNSPRKSA